MKYGTLSELCKIYLRTCGLSHTNWWRVSLAGDSPSIGLCDAAPISLSRVVVPARADRFFGSGLAAAIREARRRQRAEGDAEPVGLWFNLRLVRCTEVDKGNSRISCRWRKSRKVNVLFLGSRHEWLKAHRQVSLLVKRGVVTSLSQSATHNNKCYQITNQLCKIADSWAPFECSTHPKQSHFASSRFIGLLFRSVESDGSHSAPDGGDVACVVVAIFEVNCLPFFRLVQHREGGYDQTTGSSVVRVLEVGKRLMGWIVEQHPTIHHPLPWIGVLFTASGLDACRCRTAPRRLRLPPGPRRSNPSFAFVSFAILIFLLVLVTLAVSLVLRTRFVVSFVVLWIIDQRLLHFDVRWRLLTVRGLFSLLHCSVRRSIFEVKIGAWTGSTISSIVLSGCSCTVVVSVVGIGDVSVRIWLSGGSSSHPASRQNWAVITRSHSSVITLSATCAVVVVGRARLQYSNTSKWSIEKESLWVKN